MTRDGEGLKIRVLGPLMVTIDGAPIVVDTRKALAILALLAVERRPIARDELAAMFWPESDDASARGALRRTLSVMRGALGNRWLAIDRSTVELDRAVWVDLLELEAAAAVEDPVALARTASLARGPFLATFSLHDSVPFDDWRATKAAAVERSVTRLLDRLVDRAAATDDLATAIGAAIDRIGIDPLDEGAHRRLMTLLAVSGDRSGAIRQYRNAVALLERELGVSPLTETTGLYEAIRDGSVGPSQGQVMPAHQPGPTVKAEADRDRPASFRLPLVGRATALNELLEAYASTTTDGIVMAVVGEAGIGKTRLVDELVGRVRPGRDVVLRTAAYPAESAIAFAPIVALLQAGLGRSDAVERLSTIEAWQLAEIDRLVPLPASLLTARDSTSRPDSPAAQARLLESIASGLVALTAGPRPGLAVLDDVQWADEASRGAILYLARRLAGRPLILVVSWRPEDLDDLGLAFTERLREIATLTVQLDRLDRADVAELVRAAGLSGSGFVAQAEALSERSEGLPLYVVEALATRPGQGAETVELPRGMRALLRERIASVGEASGQVLAAASVVGRSFDLTVLRAAAGRSEEETISALEELTRRGLVRERAGRSITYDFAHGTLRDATYESMSLARRRLLHHRVAVAIREQGGWRDDPERLALIAGHERDAGRDAEAAEAFLEAGLRQRAVYAHHEAALAFSAALALRHPDAVAIQRALGEIHMAQGDYRAALSALEAGAAIAPADELPAIELRLAQVHARRGDLVAARSHLDASIAGLGDPERDSLARQALIERARIALRAGDVEAATASASEALGAAEVAGATTDVGLALRMRGLAERAKGDLSAARDDLSRSVAIAEEAEDAAASIGARNALALVEAADGDREAAIARLEAALEDARRTGERHLEAAIENNLADQLHAAGAEDAAMAHLKRAVVLFADIGGEPNELEPEIWKLVAW